MRLADANIPTLRIYAAGQHRSDCDYAFTP